MKRRRRAASRSFSGMGFYLDMWKAGMQAAEMAQASAEVIWHRSAMMQRSLSGELPMNHKEYTRMWQEKMAAGNAAWLAALAGDSSVKGLMKVMQPFSSKAKSNAKRLRKAKRS